MTNLHSKIHSHQQRLEADFPSLQISSVEILGSGWDHDAVEVNGDIVFRIPKGDFDFTQASPVVAYETEILKLLHGKLPITIPFPEYIAPHKSYFGYTKLPGVILKDALSSFGEQDLMNLQEEWVMVVAAIHAAININEARKLGVPDFEGQDTSMAEQIFDLPDIDKPVLEWADKIINKVHSLNMENQNHVVAHNDLRFQNILVDPKSRNISGIIDWSDICVAPIAREFAASDWEGEAVSRVVRLYENEMGVAIDMMQIRMWRHLEDISDYVEYIEEGKTHEALEILARIKQAHLSVF